MLNDSNSKFVGPNVSAPLRGGKTLVTQRVYIQLKTMIARRELPPGTRLVLRALAERLNVSNTPIIEAVRRLERDGLITVVPELGATVKQWTRQELLEAFHIRRALEREAARLFVKQADSYDKKKLVQLADEFDRAAATDAMTADDVDINLHLHIVRSTRYRHLYEMVENSKIETTVLHGLAISRVESPEEVAASYRASIGCHQTLVEALLGGDPDAAERAICAHIDTALNVILKTEELAGRVEDFGYTFGDFPRG